MDLRNTDICADLSTVEGRESAIEVAKLQCYGKVDSVIAAAPKALTEAVNYFGLVQFVEGLQPLLAESADPRVVVVSSMVILQENLTERVDTMLAGDEPKALRIGDKLQPQGPAVGYPNYPSSKRSISRWLRRESTTAIWAGPAVR